MLWGEEHSAYRLPRRCIYINSCKLNDAFLQASSTLGVDYQVLSCTQSIDWSAKLKKLKIKFVWRVQTPRIVKSVPPGCSCCDRRKRWIGPSHRRRLESFGPQAGDDQVWDAVIKLRRFLSPSFSSVGLVLKVISESLEPFVNRISDRLLVRESSLMAHTFMMSSEE